MGPAALGSWTFFLHLCVENDILQLGILIQDGALHYGRKTMDWMERYIDRTDTDW